MTETISNKTTTKTTKAQIDSVAILYLPENELGSIGFVPAGSIAIPCGMREDSTMSILMLYTGSNIVSSEKWEIAKKNRLVQEKLEKEVLIEIRPSGKIEPDSLDGYKVNDAKKLINATNRVSQLEIWGTKTKNQTIYDHINNRIRTLKQGL